MQTLQSQIRLCGKAQWVLAALSAVGIVGFYFGLYRPRTNRLHELTAAVLKQQQDLRSGQSRARALPEVAVEVRNLRAQLDQIRRPSKRNELPQFIKDLTQLGQQASLKKFNYKPGVPARSDLYAELPMRLSFEGDFVNVFN
ncbi:MAG: type 4a pilus biogenesis protein PilO, partial [Tepidisphaeraceae bacterium]